MNFCRASHMDSPCLDNMKQGKSHQEEEEEEEEEELSMKKEGPPTNKDGKNNDKVNAMRSKHSVTEQRRRSKINERFQILRDLIPHSDQKRDTASFLLEVIEYVQYLQEKVQKYEGSYQGLSPEPTKLMPWRNSHWRVQSFVGHPQAINNCSGPGSAFSGKFDDNNVNITPNMLVNAQSPVDSDLSRDVTCKVADHQSELCNKAITMPMSLQSNMPASVRSESGLLHPLQGPVSDAQSTDCPVTSDVLGKKEELMIEGGTISISSAYSQGLLNTLTQALQSSGVDLSQASVSVRIDLGKRANRGTSIPKDHENPRPSNHVIAHHGDANNADDPDQAQKRLKTKN